MPPRHTPQPPKAAIAVGDKPSEPLMNRDDLARLLSCTPGTVTRYARDGMPVAKGGGNGVQAFYLPSACVRWQLEQVKASAGSGTLNGPAERARKDRARAELDEMRLARERRNLLPREQVVREGKAFVKAAMAKVGGLIARLVRAGIIQPAAAPAAGEIIREAQAEMERWQTELDLLAAVEVEPA